MKACSLLAVLLLVGCASKPQYVAPPSLNRVTTHVTKATTSVEKATTSNKELNKLVEELKISEVEKSSLLTVLVRQESELRDANGNLLAAARELEVKQEEINQLAIRASTEHDLRITAEKRVAEKSAAILRRNVLIGLLVGAIVAYCVLHFGYRILP